MSGAETEWVLIGIEENMARRQGLPERIPVPKQRFEELADKGLDAPTVRGWIKDFLDNSEPGKSGAWRKQNHQLVMKLEGFLDKQPLWDKAQKGFAENNFEAALTALKRIVAMDPDDHSAKLNLASALANQRDYDGALKHFKAIYKSYKGDAEFHVAIGHVYLAMKNEDAALEEMVNALEIKPDHKAALDAMVQMRVLTPIFDDPRDAASLTYVRSDKVAEYLTGQWDAAPRPPEFFLEQLAYHEREARFDVVLAAAERAIKAAGDGPTSERAELARLAALRMLGRKEEALEAAQAYAEKVGSAPARVELAKCLAAVGRVEEGHAEVDRALAIDPGDQQALSFRFWPADPNDISKLASALGALEEFVKAHPESAGASRSLARAYLTINREDEALALFAKAVKLAPDDDDLRAEYWSELGKALRWEDILKDAETIADLRKRDWRVRWNEAEAYAGLDRKVEARACFSAINFDESLHVDVRKRAKRAVKRLDEGGEPLP
jgi:tetratricopeptide (TPR) repeat protein